MDRIYIRDLAVHCLIGLHPEERKNKREVIIHVVLETDLRAAGKSDELADTVDYEAIQLAIFDLVKQSRFKLIESLAEGIATRCLQDRRVRSATVTVEKPGALPACRNAAVEITRTRNG